MARKKRQSSQRTKFRSTQAEVRHYRELVKKTNQMLRYLKGDYYSRRSLRVDKFETRKEFIRDIKSLERRVLLGTRGYRLWRNDIFKENYIAHLRERYGTLAEEYAQRLENVDSNKFYSLYKNTGYLPDIYTFNYHDDLKLDIEFWNSQSEELELALSKLEDK